MQVQFHCEKFSSFYTEMEDWLFPLIYHSHCSTGVCVEEEGEECVGVDGCSLFPRSPVYKNKFLL